MFRNQGRVSVDNDTESVEVGAVNEPFAVQEQQHDGASIGDKETNHIIILVL